MCRSKATYTSSGSTREGSTCETGEFAARPGTFLTTFFQSFPPSVVTCRLPSSVPAQRTPARKGDSAKLIIVVWYSAPVFSKATGPPADFCFDLSLVVKSGLMTVQDLPKSVDLKTTLPVR